MWLFLLEEEMFLFNDALNTLCDVRHMFLDHRNNEQKSTASATLSSW